MTQKASTKETIGIIAWGAMADVLYATPIVRQIRRMNPDADISWLIRDKFAEVVDTNPDINHVVRFTLPEGHASRQDAEYEMDRAILQYAQDRYDRVIDLQYWPRHSNFFQNPSEDFISLRARNAGLPSPGDRSIVLEYTPGDLQATADFLHEHGIAKPQDKFITVNHISYAASPVWSLENYQLLVGYLKNRDIKCVFTGAPNEPIPDGAIDARGMPYRVWASLIGVSDLWLGLDSGAVALACAGNTPIIKLHSPDFPLNKTGIKAMGLRTDSKVLELCPAPNAGTLTDFIEGYTCKTSTS
tara:strand:+ start:1588 stop:2490 length:903 start_codon:yes stop_codon:yes gene_type:complete